MPAKSTPTGAEVRLRRTSGQSASDVRNSALCHNIWTVNANAAAARAAVGRDVYYLFVAPPEETRVSSGRSGEELRRTDLQNAANSRRCAAPEAACDPAWVHPTVFSAVRVCPSYSEAGA